MPARFLKSGPICALLAVLSLTAYAVPTALASVPKSSIDNFDQVAPHIYRGGNPNESELVQLKELGVTTIVDLQMRRCASEEAAVKRHGMEWRHIPLGYWAPSDKSVQQVMDVLSKASASNPVFIHCKQGADRTGTVIALYRMTVQNWSYDDAYKEMRAHHFKPWWFALKEKVETVDERRRAAPTVVVSAEK